MNWTFLTTDIDPGKPIQHRQLCVDMQHVQAMRPHVERARDMSTSVAGTELILVSGASVWVAESIQEICELMHPAVMVRDGLVIGTFPETMLTYCNTPAKPIDFKPYTAET